MRGLTIDSVNWVLPQVFHTNNDVTVTFFPEVLNGPVNPEAWVEHIQAMAKQKIGWHFKKPVIAAVNFAREGCFDWIRQCHHLIKFTAEITC